MAQGDPMKWNMPGWRIEQKFSPGVLIGNWGEDRYSFMKGATKHNSIHRIDFQNFGSHRPDVTIRRKAQLANDVGLGKENLFYHHGNRYSNNMISWYDEHYNKRERDENNKLPELRAWDSNTLAWAPERSDYPIQGAPTNFGLLSKKKGEWGDQIADELHGDYQSTYSASYIPRGNEDYVKTRYAIPRQNSSSLHKANMINKDTSFRSKSFLQSPERPPTISANPAAPIGV